MFIWNTMLRRPGVALILTLALALHATWSRTAVAAQDAVSQAAVQPIILLAIGTDDYAHFPSLTRAGDDARSVTALFAARAGMQAADATLMNDRRDGTDRFPAGGNIRAHITTICQAATPAQTLVVFISGRAVLANGKAFIVPSDGDPTKPDSLVSVAWLRDSVTASKAGGRVLVLDLWHGDAGIPGGGRAEPDPLGALRTDLGAATFATWVLHGEGRRSSATAGHADWLDGLDAALAGLADVGPGGNGDGVVSLAEIRDFADRVADANAAASATKPGSTVLLGRNGTSDVRLARLGDEPRVRTIRAGQSAWQAVQALALPAEQTAPLGKMQQSAAGRLAAGQIDAAVAAYEELIKAAATVQGDVQARVAATTARNQADDAARRADAVQAAAQAPAHFAAGAAARQQAATAWAGGRIADATAAWNAAAASYERAIADVRQRRFAAALGASEPILATYGGDAWAILVKARQAGDWGAADAALVPARDASTTALWQLARQYDNPAGAPTALLFLDQLVTLQPDHAEALALRRRLRSNTGFIPGQQVKNSLNQPFAYIPPGTFQMGSPESEFGHEGDETLHAVTLTLGYFLGVTEVTQSQFIAVMGADYRPAQGVHPNDRHPAWVGDDLPKFNVTWDEANLYCTRLGERDGRRYRLPTEAEWEYACRAGGATAYTNGKPTLTSQEANVYEAASNLPQSIVKTARFAANAWGLHDLHGNVWEWCADVYAAYPAGPATDPVGPPARSVELDLLTRVLRGGSWYDEAIKARCANRWATKPVVGSDYIGFRVLLEADTAPRTPTSDRP